jgi:hypothetical protein
MPRDVEAFLFEEEEVPDEVEMLELPKPNRRWRDN